jgi:hypothetical protein
MKVGRNAPCPCGSGRKFKRCCADKVDTSRADWFIGAEVNPWDEEEEPAEIRDLGELAHMLAILVASGGPEALTPQMHEFLTQNFDFLIYLLDGFLAAAIEPEEFGEDLSDAYEYMLGVQLNGLGIGVGSNYEWAQEVFDDFQRRLVGAMRNGEASSREMLAMSKALFEAKLQPSRELVAASEELLKRETAGVRAGVDPAALGAEISRQCGGDPFMIHTSLFAASHLGSAEFRAQTIRALVENPQAPMREAAALAALDPDPDVRRETAAALLEHCHAITPATLRRLITMRGWVAEPERGLIDQAVKAARLAGIECAQWPRGAEIVEIRASAPDGAGAQTAIVVTRAGRGNQLSGLLFKHGKGIADAWTAQPQSKREIRQILDETSSQEVYLMPVSRAYLDRTMNYYLRVGLEQNTAPAVRLLEVAELLHAPQWQPAQAGWREVLEHLIGEVADDLLAADSVRAIIASSAKWAMDRRWAASWAEQGEEVSDLLETLDGRPIDKVRNAILDAIIEKRRAIWAERFTLTAVWMKEAQSRARLPWRNFAIVAQKLIEEFPLREIGVMNEIAEATAFL